MMTGQITNKFKYEGETYELVAYHGESLYAAEDFGITPQMASTACWRGYQTFYDCVDGELILDSLHVRTEDKIAINGVVPRKNEELAEDSWAFFNTIYENLSLKTKFTGSILLGKDFIREMYVHMGFQSPESFKTVIDIEVSDGNIIKITDVSARMEERRKHGLEKPSSPPTYEDKDVGDWIKDRFSQDYKSE
ncbi:MAG: hypothetical protein KAJ36_06785 [Candidatus Thorarchaeota archaeon]|nr:hypothetical protein [Candidatus Thorarchaeota archaeon]